MSELYTRLMNKPMCEYCQVDRWNCGNLKHRMKMNIIDEWFTVAKTNSGSKILKPVLELDAVDEVYEKLTPIFDYFNHETEDEIILAIKLSSLQVFYKKSQSEKSDELKCRILYQRVCDSIIRKYLRLVYDYAFKNNINNIHKLDIEQISTDGIFGNVNKY